MEGSESGALVPSDPIMEVETWVKLSNFPAEFLTAEAISLIVSSFGSPVAADEDTFEKVENHKRPPKLRRKLHSRKTFVSIWVSVSVTKPLPSRLTVECPKGREYFIRLDFDPTPKVCLLCLGAGHFDFECCGTDKESEEIIAEAGVGFDGFCADFHGEQEAATTDGLHSYEDSTVVEAALMADSHILPAASCIIGAAAAPELMPLLLATDHEVQGTLIAEGSGSLEDPPVLDVDPLILPPAPCTFGAAVSDLQPEVGDLAAVPTISEGVDVTSSVEKIAAVLEVVPLLPQCDIGATVLQAMILAAPCIADEQLSGVFHKWRDFTDDQWRLEDGSGTGVGLLGVEMQEVDCLLGIGAFIDGVHGVVTIDRAEFHGYSPVVEADLAENFPIFDQLSFVVNSPRKHHKWRDKSAVLGLWCDTLDEQGMFSFDKLDLLQMLSRLVWNLAATYYEQVCFKIHHKWRDKGY